MAEVSLSPIPGLIELHSHWREPSIREEVENFEKGTEALMLGGYVAGYDMPNNPGFKTITLGRYQQKVRLARRILYTHLGIHAGFDPQESTVGEFAELMYEADSAKFYMGDTFGNSRIYGAADYREATRVIKEVNPKAVTFLHAHPETLDETLHMITREFNLAAHVCHVKVENLPLIHKYKKLGATVTSGVTPHHILMSEHDTLRMGWMARMMPPLEAAPDAKRLLRGLADGEIEVVENDHAPHPKPNKFEAEIENPLGLSKDEHGNDCATCNGVPGNEFSFPIMRNMVRKNLISMERLVDAYTYAPAKIMGLKHHPKTKTYFNDEVFEITEKDIKSLCGMSPYVGSIAVGRLVNVIIKGVPRILPNGKLRPMTHPLILRRGSII